MRRKNIYPLIHADLAAMVLCLLCTTAQSAEVVNFPDKNLEAAIRQAIHKPEGDILQTDLVGTGFTSLEVYKVRSEPVMDLRGLEYCMDLASLSILVEGNTDISALSQLANLTKLDLGCSKICDISALKGLINVKRLYLDENQIQDASPLAGLINLEYLSLTNNAVRNLRHINALKSLTNLHQLCLEYNQIRDISTLVGLTNLECLRLNANQITDISALVANTWFYPRAEVYLSGNPLSQNASKDSAKLYERGVEIIYDSERGGRKGR